MGLSNAFLVFMKVSTQGLYFITHGVFFLSIAIDILQKFAIPGDQKSSDEHRNQWLYSKNPSLHYFFLGITNKQKYFQ